MKPLLFKLLLPTLLIVAACHHTDVPQPADVNYTDDLSQAQTWFEGQWKLTAISAMIPNPTVPNVQLMVNNNQITVIQDGQVIDQVSFSIVKTPYFLQLKPTTQPQQKDWYVRESSLQVSTNRLFLDTGRAIDLPGYYFERFQ